MKTSFKSTKTDVDIKKNNSFLKEIRKNKFLYLLTLPGIIWLIIFCYIPMAGIVIAFQKYNPIKGITGSKFVGLDNFKFFFMGNEWKAVTFNTLYLNLLFIITGTIASLAIAIMVTEIVNKKFKKITQSLMILPHFMSWAVIAMFSVMLFSMDGGIINSLITSLGFKEINFYTSPEVWPTTLVLLRLWKGAGFSAIVYIAAIMGIDRELYEAAAVDGASKFRCILTITLPLLKPTVIILTLLGIGNIFRGDFGMIYSLVGDNSLLFGTTDVIDTYVYRALRTSGSMGMSAAVGLYQSFIGFILVLGSNKLAKMYSSESAIF